MTGDGQRASLPRAGVIAALMAVTIGAAVLISALVIDGDAPPAAFPDAVELVYKSGVVPARGLLRVDAHCPAGKVVTGGGTYADAVSQTLLVLDSTPVRTGRRYAWRVRFSNKSASEIAVGSVAICAAAAPGRSSPGVAGDDRPDVVNGRTTPSVPAAPTTTTRRP
jgi:hypothetical protein